MAGLSQLIPAVFLLITLLPTLTLQTSVTLTINHASSLSPSKTWEQVLFDSVAGDAHRLFYLSNLATKKTIVPIASGRQVSQTANYIVRASIGTPPQRLLMAMDTSSDAAWIPCSGCVGCSSSLFATAQSPTFKPLPCTSSQCHQLPNPTCPAPAASCSFNITYGAASFQANLSQDTLTLADDSVPSYTFACLQRVAGAAVPAPGLLGLGRGKLSLISQTDSLYHSTFSYCLPSIKAANFSGSLRLGVAGQPIRIKTTPLLHNPRRSSLYYVNLVSIRVGRHVVPIPPAALSFNPTTGAGTVIDSGTVFTRLVAPAYEAVRDEYRRRVKKPATALGGFDTCFEGPIVAPTVTFQLEGANVTLPPENLLIHSSSSSLSCLAMAASPENVNSVVNVIASWQLQNHRVLVDLPNNRVGFAREPCSGAI